MDTSRKFADQELGVLEKVEEQFGLTGKIDIYKKNKKQLTNKTIGI